MQEQPYSESRGMEVIDWRSVCEHFRDNSDYKVSELETYTEKACCWQLCAVGQQSSRIPRGENFHAPLDSELGALGVGFAVAFEDKNFDTALDILGQIEVYAEEFLATLD